MITKRNTDFNMQEKAVPADGVITGYGVVNSNLVYIYSQDVTALNGSVGEMHAKKIAGIYEMAMKAGAPVIGLIDCAGIRVQEAMDALAGFGDIYMAKVNASGVIPQISAVLGSCGGGVLLVYVVVQVIQDAVVTPKVMGKMMGLRPAIILLSLSIWGYLMGIIGLIIALPMTTLIIDYYKQYVVKEELTDEI